MLTVEIRALPGVQNTQLQPNVLEIVFSVCSRRFTGSQLFCNVLSLWRFVTSHAFCENDISDMILNLDHLQKMTDNFFFR